MYGHQFPSVTPESLPLLGPLPQILVSSPNSPSESLLLAMGITAVIGLKVKRESHGVRRMADGVWGGARKRCPPGSHQRTWEAACYLALRKSGPKFSYTEGFV